MLRQGRFEVVRYNDDFPFRTAGYSLPHFFRHRTNRATEYHPNICHYCLLCLYSERVLTSPKANNGKQSFINHNVIFINKLI